MGFITWLISLLAPVTVYAGDLQIIDISQTDFSGLMEPILSIIPVLLPVIITFIGMRKGISFLKSMLRGA